MKIFKAVCSIFALFSLFLIFAGIAQIINNGDLSLLAVGVFGSVLYIGFVLVASKAESNEDEISGIEKYLTRKFSKDSNFKIVKLYGDTREEGEKTYIDITLACFFIDDKIVFDKYYFAPVFEKDIKEIKHDKEALISFYKNANPKLYVHSANRQLIIKFSLLVAENSDLTSISIYEENDLGKIDFIENIETDLSDIYKEEESELCESYEQDEEINADISNVELQE